jgi:putative endonuclease
MKLKNTGDMGEKLALGFLKKQGYRVLETNYRCRTGEIDIVACQNRCLVFIEVRTKTNKDFGLPEESMSAAKIQHLERTAEFYRQNHSKLPEMWRIDFVAVELDTENKVKRIELIENAIEGEYHN